MLVQGATPGRGAAAVHGQGQQLSPRGRELNIHFDDLERGFLGQISHLGDMVTVMAGIAFTFKARRGAGGSRLHR